MLPILLQKVYKYFTTFKVSNTILLLKKYLHYKTQTRCQWK